MFNIPQCSRNVNKKSLPIRVGVCYSSPLSSPRIIKWQRIAKMIRMVMIVG